MDEAVNYCLNVTEASRDFLETLHKQMKIVADLSRADLLLYGRKSGNEAVVLAHAQPHSIARVYNKSRQGRVIDIKKRPEVFHALISGMGQKEIRSFITEGAPVVRKAYPVFYPPAIGPDWSSKEAQVVACLCVVTNLIEYERHRLRKDVFRNVVAKLQDMVLRAQVHGAEELTPFGEQDGVIFVDDEGFIRYTSGVAVNLYRRIGYKESLLGRHLTDLQTMDQDIWHSVLEQNRCLELESQEGDRYWIRKALPIVSYPDQLWRWMTTMLWLNLAAEKRLGVLITLHDATETRRQDEELRIKNAMIQEVHHRVKNNLQTIAGLVRMQARRIKSDEAKIALDETLHRILSVAVIHEFLSNENTNIINIKEVSQRIMGQFQQGMLSPDQHIRLELVGDAIYLPARQATACSLIINELLQNALEHGFATTKEGTIMVDLQDTGDDVIINVADDGDGLPNDFEIEQTSSLGFQIVKILVEGDLRGEIQFINGHGSSDDESSLSKGLSVRVTFPKIIFEGERGWKERVSL